jgi:acyl-CoA synthetase (AMP-forming)/AMP-acid ligase II
VSVPVEGATTLVATLTWRALHEKDAPALTFVGQGTSADFTFTYAALDERVRGVAAALQQRLTPGERAILLFPPGPDYAVAFLACLYAGVVAVPAYPPQGRRQTPRLAAVVADAGATLALTNAATRERCGAPLADWLATVGLSCLDVDGLADGDAWHPPALQPTDVAFLQYTSGSTGTPKGVMVRHDNLMHNEQLVYDAFGHGPASVSLLWVPPYHDMGLIGGILQPLFGGFLGVLMSPLAFLRHPLGWLHAIDRYGATTSGGPNFAFALCASKAADAAPLALDLSRWRLAFNGAEPVRANTLAAFTRAFAPYGFDARAFYPCYGLAEATLLVSGGPVRLEAVRASALEAGRVEPAVMPDERVLVGSGRVLGDQRVCIVQPETLKPVSAGEVGEIWLSGPGVAAGYWNRPESSEACFRARLAGEDTRLAEKATRLAGDETAYLRTGDLGFLSDGHLVVTGRLKDLIIVSGRNHYPQDLEATATAAHPALGVMGGCAFALEGALGESVVLIHEIPKGTPAIETVISAIRLALVAGHDLEVSAVVLVAPGGVLRTSSGKVRRAACRTAWLAGELPTLAVWHELDLGVGTPL